MDTALDDSSVQTYVDGKGRTRVSRVRGMGVRMTRDLQWNLYLMKDVENRQASGEPKDDNEPSLAESLVNSGDAEFQRLMTGDKASVPEPFARLSSEPLEKAAEVKQLVHDGESHVDLAEGAVQKAIVHPDVMPPVSSIQITFNDSEVAEDEDLDMFKDLVGDEDGHPPVQSQFSEPPAVADDDDCEWEDGDRQVAKEVDLGSKGTDVIPEPDHRNGSHTEPGTYISTVNNLSLGGDSDAEMALAIQESLAEHDRVRAAQPGMYPDSEYTGPSDDSDTGDSGESEVEWEDGSGAMAVPAVGYNVAGPRSPAALKDLLYSNFSGFVDAIFVNASSVFLGFPSDVVPSRCPSRPFIV